MKGFMDCEADEIRYNGMPVGIVHYCIYDDVDSKLDGQGLPDDLWIMVNTPDDLSRLVSPGDISFIEVGSERMSHENFVRKYLEKTRDIRIKTNANGTHAG